MPTLYAVSPAPGLSRARLPPQHSSTHTRDEQFVSMLEAYRSTGGLAPIGEVTLHLQRHSGRTALVLGEWIARGDVICFQWQGRRWIPWFQLDRQQMAPYPQLKPTLAELGAVYDAWEMGIWFATQNPWLASRMPVNVFGVDPSEVWHAARADRFIANG